MPGQAQHITWGWQLQEYGAMVNKGRADENQRNLENILLHCCFTINPTYIHPQINTRINSEKAGM
jgi:hypothetical protein